MQKWIAFCLLLLCYNFSYAQTLLKGTVKDSATQETLVGVFVTIDSSSNAQTDINGHYRVKLKPGKHTVTFTYLTYATKTIQLTAANDTIIRNIFLRPLAKGLNAVVVSASMYEKNLAEETVSMSVLKAHTIECTGARTVDEAMNNVPGVNIIDGQANIRGGSGWSYGAGSRVLLLVDGLPELTADASDVKWDFLPIEDIEQVEVIKGASSVLYGSSALDGVINVRTAFPTSKPVTSFNFYEGVYGNPDIPDTVWWKGIQQPHLDGFSFLHSQKFNHLDLVCSGMLANEVSYLQGANDQRARLTVNTRYRFNNGMSAGIRGSYMYQHKGTYLVWNDDSTGIITPLGGATGPNSTLVEGLYTRIALDPYFNYTTNDGGRITVQSRYFLSNNVDANTPKGSKAALYYSEARYQKEFKYHFTLTAGVVASASTVNAQLYGIHSGSNTAGYVQLEKQINKLTLTGGARYETNKIDTIKGTSPVVMRIGANYKLAKATFIRASYGEGYRFPSIAEQFVKSNVGPIQLFPDSAIKPETGYSAEVGINQGIKLGKWMGSADLAAFWTRYNDLIDFEFGYWPPKGTPVNEQHWFKYLGFESVNVENARITGLDFSLQGEGKIGSLPVQFNGGFTAINPINLVTRDSVNKYESTHPNLTGAQKDSLAQTEILNYRSLYTAKFGFEIFIKKFTLGGNIRYNSFMVNIDKVFLGEENLPNIPQGIEIIPGIKEFRDTHHHGDYVIDAHLAFQVTKIFNISFIVKNILNRLYVDRPGYIEPPRNFTLQMGIRF